MSAQSGGARSALKIGSHPTGRQTHHLQKAWPLPPIPLWPLGKVVFNPFLEFPSLFLSCRWDVIVLHVRITPLASALGQAVTARGVSREGTSVRRCQSCLPLLNAAFEGLLWCPFQNRCVVTRCLPSPSGRQEAAGARLLLEMSGLFRGLNTGDHLNPVWSQSKMPRVMVCSLARGFRKL